MRASLPSSKSLAIIPSVFEQPSPRCNDGRGTLIVLVVEITKFLPSDHVPSEGSLLDVSVRVVCKEVPHARVSHGFLNHGLCEGGSSPARRTRKPTVILNFSLMLACHHTVKCSVVDQAFSLILATEQMVVYSAVDHGPRIVWLIVVWIARAGSSIASGVISVHVEFVLGVDFAVC